MKEGVFAYDFSRRSYELMSSIFIQFISLSCAYSLRVAWKLAFNDSMLETKSPSGINSFPRARLTEQTNLFKSESSFCSSSYSLDYCIALIDACLRILSGWPSVRLVLLFLPRFDDKILSVFGIWALMLSPPTLSALRTGPFKFTLLVCCYEGVNWELYENSEVCF